MPTKRLFKDIGPVMSCVLKWPSVLTESLSIGEIPTFKGPRTRTPNLVEDFILPILAASHSNKLLDGAL